MDHHALRRYRHAKRLSQADLAVQVSVPPDYILRIERGQVGSVSPLLERKLADVLEVSRGQIAPVSPRDRDVLALDLGVAQARRRAPRPPQGTV